MYKIPKRTRTSINLNTSVEGETIETQILRLINDGGNIDNEKIPIYTKPSDDVLYGTDIRGDKWDKAIEANEKINDDIDRIRKEKKDKAKEKEVKTDEKAPENGEGEESIEA